MRDLRLEIREDQKAYILIDLLSKSLSGIEYMFSNYRLNYIFVINYLYWTTACLLMSRVVTYLSNIINYAV